MVVLPSSFSVSMCVAGNGSFPCGVSLATSPRTRRSFRKRVSPGPGTDVWTFAAFLLGLRALAAFAFFFFCATTCTPNLTLRQGSSAVKPAIKGHALQQQFSILLDNHVSLEGVRMMEADAGVGVGSHVDVTAQKQVLGV